MTALAIERKTSLVLTAVGVCAALFVLHRTDITDIAQSKILAGSGSRCPYVFDKYVPSDWEQDWYEQISARDASVCEWIVKDVALVDEWLAGAKSAFETRDISGWLAEQKPSPVWSHFEYKSTCGGEPLRVPMEPLVGHLRHPLVLMPCRPPGHELSFDKRHDNPTARRNKNGVHGVVENKGYLLFTPVPEAILNQMHPGRKYLFDLGTGNWSSGSLPWFMDRYAERGITFDEIFGWEVTPVPAADYWKEVPEEIAPKIHRYNIPATAEPDSAFNVINIITAIGKPGDFIVIKLDIDHEKTETALMTQLANNPEAMNLVSEMFFEQHYENKEMKSFFHYEMTTHLPDVYEMFRNFRNAGLRLHYWP